MLGPHGTGRVWLMHLVWLFIFAVLLVMALRFWTAVKYVVLGLLASGTMASGLHPLARRVPGPKVVGAIVSVVLVLLLALVAVGGLAWLVVDVARDQAEQWPAIRDDIDGLVQRVGDAFGVDLTFSQIASDILEGLTGEGLVDLAARTVNIVSGVVIAIAFIFIGTLYLLASSREALLEPAISILPPGRDVPTRRMMDNLEPRLRRWLMGTLVSMVVVGVLSGIGYSVIGLRLALPLAIFAGVAEIIPTIGPLASLVLAILIAMTQSTTQLIGAVIVYLVIQATESYLVVPIVMKRAIRIPPIVTLLTIILWGQLFGLPGLLLALPLNLTVWSLLEQHVIKYRREHPLLPT